MENSLFIWLKNNKELGLFKAWKRIDERFDHLIYGEMNHENCSEFLSTYDSKKSEMWKSYAGMN